MSRVAQSVGDFVGGFVAHTVHSKVSPDGHWSLIIDTYDEGALGGNTTVYLRAARGGAGSHKTTLWDDDWLRDSAVRWLDARTITINGFLSTPFVEHGIDTGSSRTTGAPLDSSGYARDLIAPGERVVMLSGLAFLPRGPSAELLTRRHAAAGKPWQLLVPSRRTLWSMASLQKLRGTPLEKLASSGRVIGATRSGSIKVRWNPNARYLVVVTRLYGGPWIGLVVERDVTVANVRQARLRAEDLWRRLSVRGVRLPWRPAA